MDDRGVEYLWYKWNPLLYNVLFMNQAALIINVLGSKGVVSTMVLWFITVWNNSRIENFMEMVWWQSHQGNSWRGQFYFKTKYTLLMVVIIVLGWFLRKESARGVWTTLQMYWMRFSQQEENPLVLERGMLSLTNTEMSITGLNTDATLCLLSEHHVTAMLVKNLSLNMLEAMCFISRNKNFWWYLKCSNMHVLSA